MWATSPSCSGRGPRCTAPGSTRSPGGLRGSGIAVGVNSNLELTRLWCLDRWPSGLVPPLVRSTPGNRCMRLGISAGGGILDLVTEAAVAPPTGISDAKPARRRLSLCPLVTQDPPCVDSTTGCRRPVTTDRPRPGRRDSTHQNSMFWTDGHLHPRESFPRVSPPRVLGSGRAARR